MRGLRTQNCCMRCLNAHGYCDKLYCAFEPPGAPVLAKAKKPEDFGEFDTRYRVHVLQMKAWAEGREVQPSQVCDYFNMTYGEPVIACSSCHAIIGHRVLDCQGLPVVIGFVGDGKTEVNP